MSYFEGSATLPPPFNIFPTPKLLFRMLGRCKKDKLPRMSSKELQEKRDYRYTSVMRALVWRYVSAMHRQAEDNPVTEDDINEVKGEISAAKCEMLEVLRSNGMDISKAQMKEKAILGKKMRMWERRLMTDFHVTPVTTEGDMDKTYEVPPESEDSLARFRRIAKLSVINSASHKWGQVVEGVCAASQVGHCNKRESFKRQQNLQKAMDQARKLVNHTPTPGTYKKTSLITIPVTTASSLMELLKDITEETEQCSDEHSKKPLTEAVPSREASESTTLTSAVEKEKHSQNTAEKTEQLTKSTSNSTCSDVAMETRQSHEVSTPSTLSLPQTAASVHYVKTDSQSPNDVRSKALAPMGAQTVDFKKPPSDHHSSAYPTVLVPQQQNSGEDEAKTASPEPQTIITMAETTTDNDIKPERTMSHSTHHESTSLYQFNVMLSDNASMEAEMVESSSTEKLVCGNISPAPLRPVKRIEDVKTLKRQPKGGWI